MPMMKIYVTRKLPEEIITRLSEHFAVEMWEEEHQVVPRDVLLSKVRDADALLCLLTDTIDREIIEQAPQLKVICSLAVGYNNIDVEAASERGIVVTNTPDVLTETTADLTFALLLATARRVTDASQSLRKGEWKTWSPMQLTGQDVFGSTLGIIGLGRIAEAVIKRAKGFDMKIIYHNRTRKREKETELDIEYATLNELLTVSDFVVILIPYSPSVHHLIGKNELALMKKEAILINSARGGLVDEEALYAALINGEIWGAGLDVFEQEPVPTEHPLLKIPNVVTLPHIGSASVKTRLKMGQLAADNAVNTLYGNGPLTPVNHVTVKR